MSAHTPLKMPSEFLIAVSHELPQQDNLVNKGKEDKLFDEDYVNHLEQKFSPCVPEFSCIRNFPFNKKAKFLDIPVPNHTATKRHTLDDELNMSLPKLIKLQPELTNYHSGTAVDMVDAVRSQVIKNDVILGEILENTTINENERTDAIVKETYLQKCVRETLEELETLNRISVEAIGCAAIEDISCSDRKSSDQQQRFSKMETECAMLKLQDRNESSTSLGTGQGCVTKTENLLLNSEKRVFFAHEFAGSETEAGDYHSVHDSFSLSEFLICPSLEQKVSSDALLHPVQKEEVVGGSSITAAVDVSSGIERMDAHVMFQSENEISGDAGTSFTLDSKSDVKNMVDSTSPHFCGTKKLSHSAKEWPSSNLLQNKMPDNVGVGMTLSQTVVKEELPIKQEVEEDPMLHTIQVPSVDLLHNRELDLVDDAVFQNWFMSLAHQETVTESASTSTYDHRESSGSGHSEIAKEYSVESNTKIGNKIVDRDLPPPDMIGESGYVQLADHYAHSAQNCNVGNVTPKFLQNLFPDVAEIPCAKKPEASFEKFKNVCEELLLTSLSTQMLPKSGVTQIPTTNVQPIENKPDFVATSEPYVDNNTKSESDTIHKHHKKELIKKFSSGLINDEKSDNRSSQDNRIQTETAMKDSDLPSTSAAVTNEDKCIKDCIVISDSDDDSIIEFDIVKMSTKKRYTKSTHSNSSGKNIQSSSRKCTRNTRSSTNEQSLGQQTTNSTVKNIVIQECIVLSDSDDEFSKAPLSSNRADEAVNISDAESHVSVSDGSPRKRTESRGVIDLSGGRSPSVMSKSNSAISSAGDSNVGVFATAFTAGDSQCSLGERLGGHNSGLVTNNNMHIVAATITYNPAQSNFERESNGGDVIDLSRRNLTPLTASCQKTNSALDVLDLSGSDKKRQERHSVIRSVRSATENKSTTKDIAEDKDSSPAWSCPICFESLLSGQSVSSTPCGHVFCTKCIEEAVNQFKKCPTCCRRVALKRVHKIFL